MIQLRPSLHVPGIRFHRETLLFCTVSAYSLHVNEQNAPGKRCVWKMEFKVDRLKNVTRTPSSKVKKEGTLLLMGDIHYSNWVIR